MFSTIRSVRITFLVLLFQLSPVQGCCTQVVSDAPVQLRVWLGAELEQHLAHAGGGLLGDEVQGGDAVVGALFHEDLQSVSQQSIP